MKYNNYNKSKRPLNRNSDSSWQSVASWYDKSVGEKGHYYHQNVILPKVVKLLNLDSNSTLLDLGCGQGVLARSIPKEAKYLGFDLSPDLIRAAERQNQSRNIRFSIADVSLDLKLNSEEFSHASIILALQNIENYRGVFANISKYLQKNGKFLIVINHPYFRIPRQTSWEIDQSKKTQYRRVDRYLSSLKIPITMNPGLASSRFSGHGVDNRHAASNNKKVTWSFHNSLQDYSQALYDYGLVIEKIEEWASDKSSEGKAARMENRARNEFPMFMAIACRKI